MDEINDKIAEYEANLLPFNLSTVALWRHFLNHLLSFTRSGRLSWSDSSGERITQVSMDWYC